MVVSCRKISPLLPETENPEYTIRQLYNELFMNFFMSIQLSFSQFY